jgi:hypothetical protein
MIIYKHTHVYIICLPDGENKGVPYIEARGRFIAGKFVIINYSFMSELALSPANFGLMCPCVCDLAGVEIKKRIMRCFIVAWKVLLFCFGCAPFTISVY